MSRPEDIARYREAAHSAPDQIDWCVEYLRSIRKTAISRQLARNTSAIRRRLDDRDAEMITRGRVG
jgi:hypothetical protein